ncbi:MAG: Mrp/NBP35 family ATP-binding protein [Clostridia bacterium]|nr:Mrp/NBP35 family ATP-binding protein [Clostridia bacterium]
MSECSHDCESCSASCSSRTAPEDLHEKLNDLSKVRKVIGVVSGKGGVGKSMVTSLLAVLFNRQGKKTAILDADITGPSIPKAFGITESAKGCEEGILPAVTETGIDIISTNMFLPNDTDPVVWRGPVLSGTVKQFWTDVIWNDEDYMFVDMPPGTGDVTLTVFQSIPLDGIIIVTSPQDLVSMIVQKAVKMANMMNIPILGVVENNSYFVCDNCNKKHYIFGESKVDEVAKTYGFPVLAKLPIEPKLAELVDKGDIEGFTGDWLDNGVEIILNATK